MLTLVAGSSCQDLQSPSLLTSVLGGRPGWSVLEGSVVVRDGEESKVFYAKPFQSPPHLVVVECLQSSFAEVPYRKSDFQIVKHLASGFTIQSLHNEVKWCAWAVVKWRAEGIRAPETPPGSRTKREELIARVKDLGGTITFDTARPDPYTGTVPLDLSHPEVPGRPVVRIPSQPEPGQAPVLVDSAHPGVPIIGIDLHRTRAGDAELVLLEDQFSLRTLNLYGTKISDAGLAHLSWLTFLQVLHLNETEITDAGLQYLQRMIKLKELSLYHTKVTDRGLVFLSKLPSLQILTLGGPAITDQGLQSLKNLHDLKELDLVGTKVTDAGVRDFFRARPRVKIIK